MANRETKRWQHWQKNRQLRQVRKHIKRHRKEKPVRRRDWMPDSFNNPEAPCDLDVPTSERVMPRGERERRHDAFAEALALAGQEEVQEPRAPDGSKRTGCEGVIVEVSSSLCRVNVGERTLICGLRGTLSAEETGFTNILAVGDRVVFSRDGADRGVIESVLPRRSVLARPDVFHAHLRQVIVANADQLLIVASWMEPAFWPELVDRYLIAAQRSNLTPVICVNKTDLASDIRQCRARLQPYVDLGYSVIFASATRSFGIDGVRAALTGHTTALAGMSGVGKSSLLAAVEPGLELRTAAISGRLQGGRHTTTQVSMHRLYVGGFVVDTPGIREFGLSNLRRAELIGFYPDLAERASRCRFADCTHTHEPGCAVKQAVRAQELSPMRYHSYTKILESLPG